MLPNGGDDAELNIVAAYFLSAGEACGVIFNIYIRGGAYLGLDESRASPKCEEGDLCHGKAERAVASLLGEAGNLCLR